MFELAFKYLLSNEGTQFVNDPSDSGGATKYGVTQKSYSNFICKEISALEMERLTEDEAKKFYEELYWKPLWCDKINQPTVSVALFDTSVLYGIHNALEFSQKSLSVCGYQCKIDGVMGSVTLAFLNEIKAEDFISNFYQFNILRIEEIVRRYPKNEKFRGGWIKRAERLLTLKEVLC